MARQNRVTPSGEIIADPARGLVMGNRGILHDSHQTLGRLRWRSKAWIACKLDFRGRHTIIMAPGHYTQLFFLDEATAFAAGHRPCRECRYRDYEAFRTAWRLGKRLAIDDPLRAAAIDAALHAERLDADRAKRTYRTRLRDLPDGSMITLSDGGAGLVLAGGVLRWSPARYEAPLRCMDEEVDVLTPHSTVAAFAAGYRPLIHPSAALGAGTR